MLPLGRPPPRRRVPSGAGRGGAWRGGAGCCLTHGCRTHPTAHRAWRMTGVERVGRVQPGTAVLSWRYCTPLRSGCWQKLGVGRPLADGHWTGHSGHSGQGTATCAEAAKCHGSGTQWNCRRTRPRPRPVPQTFDPARTELRSGGGGGREGEGVDGEGGKEGRPAPFRSLRA